MLLKISIFLAVWNFLSNWF